MPQLGNGNEERWRKRVERGEVDEGGGGGVEIKVVRGAGVPAFNECWEPVWTEKNRQLRLGRMGTS